MIESAGGSVLQVPFSVCGIVLLNTTKICCHKTKVRLKVKNLVFTHLRIYVKKRHLSLMLNRDCGCAVDSFLLIYMYDSICTYYKISMILVYMYTHITHTYYRTSYILYILRTKSMIYMLS
jgi:hypothetical protein